MYNPAKDPKSRQKEYRDANKTKATELISDAGGICSDSAPPEWPCSRIYNFRASQSAINGY